MNFAKDFAWGVATAAYQIEGGAYAGDKGLNVWDVGSATKGRIFEGHTGDTACDHYRRFREDVALMKKFGIKHYRLSVNWARLIPAGTGKVSEEGKRFYLALLDEMKRAGIKPWITLFHWDYPYALYLKGGWLNGDSPAWFEEYAAVCAELFGGYTDRIILINEPQCFIGLGHYSGVHAPFLKLPASEAMRAAHNVLLACGRAERRVRAICGDSVKIGTAQAYWPAIPLREEDYELAERETFACREDFGSAAIWLDTALSGKYPEDYAAWQKREGFTYPASDMEIIRCRYDFCGLNTYSGNYVTAGDGKTDFLTPKPSVPKTDMRWNVYPDSMYYGAKFIFDRYRLPVVYTENGVALTEWKTAEGEIPDDMRIEYTKRYLRSLHRAAQEITVEGYFHWSFIDNFEWAEGFSKKFGLIYCDPETGERIPKKSAFWYQKVIESNGEEIFK